LTLPRSSTSATRSARPVWLRRRRAIITMFMTAAPAAAAPADVPAAALADGEDVRESAAAAPLLSVVGGKMGVTLYRPATFLHAWHDFETECVVAQSRPSPISVADQRALRLGRHAACRVTATPRRARLHHADRRVCLRGRPRCSIEWARARAQRVSGVHAGRMSAIHRNLPGNTGFPPAAGGGNGITFMLRSPPHW
jgi:hypothetical protein